MSHITQEQAMKIADASGVLGCEFSEFEQKMCDFANTAIQHYIDSAALAQPADTRVHLAGPDTPVYYVLHADGTYSEANPQPAQPEPVELTKEDVLAVGGIVHRDGNVFFTNIALLNKAIEAAKERT